MSVWNEQYNNGPSVLYLALIALWAECCRIVLRSADGCYTENLANDRPRIFYPAPRSRELSRTPPLPRLSPTPVESRLFVEAAPRGRGAMVLPQRRGMDRDCGTA